VDESRFLRERIMTQLRPLSPRPEIVVGSPDDARLEDPSKTQVGFLAAPLGRERVLYALPLNGDGPQQLARAEVLSGTLVADPDGNAVGVAGNVWVHRLLYAGPVADTRRLS
jgi:hypothetical protein